MNFDDYGDSDESIENDYLIDSFSDEFIEGDYLIDSFSDEFIENDYLTDLPERLTTIIDVNNDVSESDVEDLDMYDEDADVIAVDGDEYTNESDMLTDEDDSLSEASTVLNEDRQSNEVGTDTENEVDQNIEEENIIQSQKKIKLNESEKKEIDDDSDEDRRCPICLDLWNNAGEHRLCSLRCGHLFGLKCIQQWLNIAPSAASKKCPECNAKASKKDIRVLYAKNLRCLDTSEIEKLKEQLKEISTKKESTEKELKQYKLKEILYEQQLHSLKQRILVLEKTVQSITSERNNFSLHYENIVLKKHKVFDICNNNSCRVLAYNPWHKILVASSNNAISKILMDSFYSSLNFNIHSGAIRDIAFQEQHPNILLSVAFDKKIILTDIRSNLAIHSYQEETHLWSCCWSNYNNQTFFVGGAKGNITEYDIRFLQSNVSTKENSNDRSPVVSLVSVPTSNSALQVGGYLACQLNTCSAYSFKEGNYVSNQINFEGPFTSLRYNERNNHVLLSCRANAKNPFVRHIVCTLEKSEDQIQFNVVHSFNAGSTQKLLSRPCYMNLQNDTMVVANNESVNSIIAWSISTGQEVYNLPITEPVIDICAFENNGMYQAVLTSNKLYLYHHKDTHV